MGFTKAPNAKTIAPNTAIPCLFKFTYIWLNNHAEFWSKPILINKNFLGCWIWNKSHWYYSEINLMNIECFICY